MARMLQVPGHGQLSVWTEINTATIYTNVYTQTLNTAVLVPWIRTDSVRKDATGPV